MNKRMPKVDMRPSSVDQAIRQSISQSSGRQETGTATATETTGGKQRVVSPQLLFSAVEVADCDLGQSKNGLEMVHI